MCPVLLWDLLFAAEEHFQVDLQGPHYDVLANGRTCVSAESPDEYQEHTLDLWNSAVPVHLIQSSSRMNLLLVQQSLRMPAVYEDDETC